MRASARSAFVMVRFGLVGMISFGAGAARAHIELDSPNPHFVFDNDGIETAPCGSGAINTATNAPLAGGELLLVTWHETINHDGHYRIGLSANQSDFTVPTSLAIPAPPLPSWDLVDGIPDTSVGPGTFAMTITVPNIDCPHCVLQLVQIAALTADGSNTGGYYTNYYECADLSITASGGGSGGAGDGAGGRPGTDGTGGILGGPSKVSTSSSGCDVGAGSPAGTFSPLLTGMFASAWLARRRRSRRAAAAQKIGNDVTQ